ncbi:MAG: IclR family transcriptional regulator [Gammaproteobacteria bacterium]|jgi:DNA-binding IclR family transcriptional regulator
MSAADRTLDLIEAFSDSGKPLLLPELARRLDAPKSTCFELVRTLQRRGYLYSLGKRRGFYPTRRLLRHAEIISGNDPAARRLDAAMEQLRNATGETVIAGRLQDGAVVYVAAVEGLHNIRYATVPGEIKPLHSSAIGKALLAGFENLADTVAALPLHRYTENTICDPAALLADLELGRDRGYFTTVGENVREVMAIACGAAIGGDPIGLAVAGPVERIRAAEPAIAAALCATAAEFEQQA